MVDDDRHFRVLARSILEAGGFEVRESEDIEQCLAVLHKQPVDAVVLDMVMPGRDGIEAVGELKRLFPEVRIVAGALRGRKLVAFVHEGMRPTPQMVREALFSILGNAVPGRVFYDVFAGTGVVGLEAVSRGAPTN